MSEAAASEHSSERSERSSNPVVTETPGQVETVETLLREQEATIKSLGSDVEVLRKSGIVMESRLEKLHDYLCDFMGKDCPKGLKNMKWTPTITVLNETQNVLPQKGPGLDVERRTVPVPGVVRVQPKKGGGRDMDDSDDGGSVAGDKFCINYDESVYTDTSGRSLYAVRGTNGFCIVYGSVTDYFVFNEKMVGEKTVKALQAAGVKSLKELLAKPTKHYIAVQTFTMELLLSETQRFEKKKPLFLESPIDKARLHRTAIVLANVQPEPIRSAMALVVSQWALPDNEETADTFLSVLEVVDGFVSNLRGGLPAADARQKPVPGQGGAGGGGLTGQSDDEDNAGNEDDYESPDDQ